MYKRFFGEVSRVANEWQPDDLQRALGTRAVDDRRQYVTASELLLEKVAQNTDDARNRQLAEHDATQQGIRHIALYLRYGARAAARNNADIGTYVQTLATPEGITPLLSIADMPREIATPLEQHLDIKSPGYSTLEQPENFVYQWNQQQGITNPLLELAMLEAQARRPKIVNTKERRCPVDRVGLIHPLVREFSKVAIKDALLFPKTFGEA